ncbi:hypothetical protein ACH5RR_009236 [Cinchona calisaya]|uniref:Uncharacterized protein n=1 Tax=Cinchona calisaya TaxID=153742 RepID=A0ABD3AE17_9GENT
MADKKLIVPMIDVTKEVVPSSSEVEPNYLLLHESIVDDQYACFRLLKKSEPLKSSEMIDSVEDIDVVARVHKSWVELTDELEQFIGYLFKLKFHSNENESDGFVKVI